MMTVLVLGNAEEAHAVAIAQRIVARGEPAYLLDSRTYPADLLLSESPDNALRGWIQLGVQGPRLYLDEIRSVYWRYYFGVNIPEGIADPWLREIAYREIQSALGSWFRGQTRHSLWVNPADAIDMHRNKGFQLRLLAEAGIRVPRTLVTNAPESVRAFFEQENGNVIYKPVLGGAHTTRLLAEDLTDERLAALASSPVQFQEFIPGDNIRVYGIGEELFAGNIIAETIDFRDDANARIERVDLPDDVAQQCRTLMRLFGLVLTGIDIRRSPEGEYVFLEGNPSPMFLHFEAMTGYPIGDRLVDLLLGGKSG
jgi:hypothetical protein